MVAQQSRVAVPGAGAVATGPALHRGGAAWLHGLRGLRCRHTVGRVRRGAEPPMTGLTHLDENGRARMVDVSDKEVTRREATARARVSMQPETARLIASGGMAK